MVCGKTFKVKNYLVEKGFGLYCSRECQHTTYPPKIDINCKQCGKKFKIWPSKIKLIKFCSKVCKDDFKRDYVYCICKNCKTNFQIPRWELNNGKGTFCSRSCFYQYKGESSLEERMRNVLTEFKIDFIQEYKIGRYYADFYVPKLNLIIECDGEYWHLNEKAQLRDQRKDKLLESLGYKIIRMTGDQIKKKSNEDLVEIINL